MTAVYFKRYESHFIKSMDGTEIYADAVGNRSPDSPTIVLIHGGCMIKGVFDPIFEDTKWTSSVFLVRYDTRGHGRSGKPATDDAWESKRMSEDFEAVCREFNVSRAFVLGWSIGSSHFVDILTYNTSVILLGLIYAAGTIYLDPSIMERTTSRESLQIAKILADPPSVDVFQEAVFDFLHLCSKKFPSDLFRILLEGILLQPRSIVMRLASRPQNPEALLQEVREGRLPIFVLTGGKDKLMRSEGLKAVIRELGWQNYTHRHLEEADHVPWVSCPETFRDTVLGWVKDGSS